MSRQLFTSESVSMGHPDKMCDQISDAILDAMLAQDPQSRVACETLTTTGLVLVAGEVTSKSQVDVPPLIRSVVHDIGYTDSAMGFDAATCAVTVAALPLLYHNSGQLQVTYRFALDWLPFIAVGAASALPRFPRLERWIILGAIAVNLHLCFAFSHHTARLFVTSPMGWPFEGELGSS